VARAKVTIQPAIQPSSGGLKNNPPEDRRFSYDELGIDKNLAHSVRKVGKLETEAEFQAHLAKKTGKHHRPVVRLYSHQSLAQFFEGARPAS
jgi:hypothetical protein